jgi:autotransporter-associated beta strand protein
MVVLAAAATPAAAQADNWIGNSGVNSLWSNPANWFSQNVPASGTAIRIGNPAITAPVLDSSRTLSELEHARFGDSSIEVQGNSTLTFLGLSGLLIRSTSSGAFNIKPRVIAADSGLIQGFAFGGNLLFSGGLTVNAGRTVTVSQFNDANSITLGGSVVLASGATLSLDHGGGSSVYAATSTDLQNATHRSRRQGTYTLTPNFIPGSTGQLVLGSGNVTLVGAVPSGVSTTIESGTVNLGAADALGPSVTNNGTVNISVTNGYTLSSSMSGTGSVRFTGGASRLFIGNGAKSYTGETRVISGFIQPLANGALSAQSTVVLESFASGIDTRGRTIVIGGLSGVGRIYDGTGATVTLSIGNNNQSTVFSGSIEGTGAVNNGIINIVKNGTGTLDLTGNNTTTGTVTINSGSLRLNSIGAIALSLNNTIINSGTVIFNQTITGSVVYGRQVHSTGTLVKSGAGSLSLTNLSVLAGSVQVTGGSLLLGGASLPNITASISNSSQLTLATGGVVSGPISGTGELLKIGLGTAELRGSLSYTGNTTVNTGVLKLVTPLRPVTGGLTVAGGTASLEAAPAALAASASTVSGQFSSVSVSNGARLQLAEVNRSTSRPNVLITQSLTVSPTGFVDLANNDLIVRSASPSSAATAVTTLSGLVRSWWVADNGLPGSIGLGSSLAFYPAAGGFTTLAVYNNAVAGQTLTSFDGLPVSATDVLVSYTYLGDTNIDGVVDATDIARILQGMAGQGTGWNFGDVNYDGLINTLDLGRAVAALRGQGAPLGQSLSGGGSAIPEPAGLAALVLPAFALTRRRPS